MSIWLHNSTCLWLFFCHSPFSFASLNTQHLHRRNPLLYVTWQHPHHAPSHPLPPPCFICSTPAPFQHHSNPSQRLHPIPRPLLSSFQASGGSKVLQFDPSVGQHGAFYLTDARDSAALSSTLPYPQLPLDAPSFPADASSFQAAAQLHRQLLTSAGVSPGDTREGSSSCAAAAMGGAGLGGGGGRGQQEGEEREEDGLTDAGSILSELTVSDGGQGSSAGGLVAVAGEPLRDAAGGPGEAVDGWNDAVDVRRTGGMRRFDG